jgi:hypothetical protein
MEIYAEEEGEGNPALVFIHYWGGSRRTWSGVIARLSDRVRCIATHRVFVRTTSANCSTSLGSRHVDGIWRNKSTASFPTSSCSKHLGFRSAIL